MAAKSNKRRRLSVEPSAELWLLLDELRDTTNVATASLVRSILDQMKPELRVLIDAAKGAREGRGVEAINAMTQALLNVRDKSEQLGLELEREVQSKLQRKRNRVKHEASG